MEVPAIIDNMKNKILFALIAVGVVIYVLAIIFVPSKKERFLAEINSQTESEDFFNKSELKTANRFGQDGDFNIWKNSTNDFVITLPHEWEIQQHDSETSSIIFIFEPVNLNQQISIWFYGSDKISFEDWITSVTTPLYGIDDCGQEKIGEVYMFCKVASSEGQTRKMYFYEIEEGRFVGMAKPVSDESNELDSIIATISFSPSKIDLESALIIP